MIILWNICPTNRNKTIQTNKTPMLAANPNTEELPVPRLSKPIVWVKGDSAATIWPAAGILSTGMNMPLTNIRGILTKFRGTITSPGLPVGIEAKSIPIAE